MRKIKSLVIMIIFVLVGLTGCSDYNTEKNIAQQTVQEVKEKEDEIILVTDKWIKRTDDRDLYLIGTENEVFKIEDNGFIFKFNSSDLYNQIKVGKKYKIETTGVRSNFMSWYRNINKIELVEEE